MGFKNKNVPACYIHPLLLLAYSTTSIPLSFSFSQELMKAAMSKDSKTMQNYIADAEIRTFINLVLSEEIGIGRAYTILVILLKNNLA